MSGYKGARVPQRNWLTPEGARELKHQIEVYWAARVAVLPAVRVERAAYENAPCVVRSDIVNGNPAGHFSRQKQEAQR